MTFPRRSPPCQHRHQMRPCFRCMCPLLCLHVLAAPRSSAARLRNAPQVRRGGRGSCFRPKLRRSRCTRRSIRHHLQGLLRRPRPRPLWCATGCNFCVLTRLPARPARSMCSTGSAPQNGSSSSISHWSNRGISRQDPCLSVSALAHKALWQGSSPPRAKPQWPLRSTMATIRQRLSPTPLRRLTQVIRGICNKTPSLTWSTGGSSVLDWSPVGRFR